MTIEECRDTIDKWFLSDTVELIDLVLNDDTNDPQYSAITTWNRLSVYCQYMKLTKNDYLCDSIQTMLDRLGYEKREIDLLREKCIREKSTYRSSILDRSFLIDP